MSEIFGLAGLNASDYAYVNNANQELVYEGARQYIDMANEATMRAMSLFVDPQPTNNFKERYKLGMTGRMQRTSEDTPGKGVATYGSWDVAYPLYNYHERLNISDVDLAYMTPAEYQNHVDGIITRSRETRRYEILYHLFNNTQKSFTDKRHGALTIEPLANGDSVVYPPVEGSDTEATENHYLESGYAASSISDTNNPIRTLVNELVEHGINTTNDVPIVCLINEAQQDAIESLANFVPYIPSQIERGMDTDQVSLGTSRPIPGKIIGYLRGYAWISVWAYVPANYILASNLAAPYPLKMRVDPPATGLGNGGLVMLPEERQGVINLNSWRVRFGVGVANRLGAAVMELGTGGTYTVPSAYS